MAEEIPNERSTARDHLANERTFLAWIRTALGVMGFGVVLERVIGVTSLLSTSVAVGLVLFGASIVPYAIYRYEHVNRRLKEGQFAVAHWGPMIFGLLALVVVIGGLALIVSR